MYEIYGVTDCPHCLRAQALCMDKGVDYSWVMMDWSKDYREKVKDLFDWKTYPIIVKLDLDSLEMKVVGGFDELQKELLSSVE
jgi:glutaredoxin